MFDNEENNNDSDYFNELLGDDNPFSVPKPKKKFPFY